MKSAQAAVTPMYDRRLMRGVTTFCLGHGYVRCVKPSFVVEQFYMLGDHGGYCPIAFR